MIHCQLKRRHSGRRAREGRIEKQVLKNILTRLTTGWDVHNKRKTQCYLLNLIPGIKKMDAPEEDLSKEKINLCTLNLSQERTFKKLTTFNEMCAINEFWIWILNLWTLKYHAGIKALKSSTLLPSTSLNTNLKAAKQTILVSSYRYGLSYCLGGRGWMVGACQSTHVWGHHWPTCARWE